MRRRRQSLGLSPADLADRAGLSPERLARLESSGTADGAVLARLAAALGTSAAELLGGPGPRADRTRRGAVHPVLAELSEEECWARLTPGGVGRVSVPTDDGPVVLPVNYRVHDGVVLYRTAGTGILASPTGRRVAFEVDGFDTQRRSGWSVLVSGTAFVVDDPDAVEQMLSRADPDPWPAGERATWMGVAPSHVTGRVLAPRE
ncbi:pyridoxamine 5'-phosphate oxidase family protein [Kitasatospora griseola]|uniref:pyridoxamine 5'-phosphate oxidase family protein n=1 Tax=Kitasatospora griseola TaxID=2064 RepID=UPI0013791DB5|nr:pyridoxamine 5'-phosphate oxidase family protein [Kitasatospora griseola]